MRTRAGGLTAFSESYAELAMKVGAFSLFLSALIACTSFSPSNRGGPDAAPSPLPEPDAAPPPPTTPLGFRRAIFVSPPPIDEPVENTPIALHLFGDAHFRDNARADGADVLVTASGTRLDIDFETVDLASGTLVAWVVLPLLPVEGIELSLIYGGEPSTTANPWAPIAELVWHMDSIEGDIVADHSSAGVSGTRLQGEITATNRELGAALQFTDAVLGVPSNDAVDGGTRSFAVSMWFRQSEAVGAADSGFFNGGPLLFQPGYQVRFGSGRWLTAVGDSVGREVVHVLGDEDVLGPSGWHQFILSVDRDSAVVNSFVDGELVASSALPSGFGSVRNTSQLARVGGFGDLLRGSIDEVRFLTFAVSADWAAVDYAGGVDELVTIGNPEPIE